MQSFGFFYRSFLMQLKSAQTYRFNFWLGIVGVLFMYASQLIVMWTTLSYFKVLDGWNMYEISLMFGFWLFSYGLVILFFAGIRDFSGLVYSGQFDTLLIRPHSILLQAISGRMEIMSWGHFGFGGLVLWWALDHLNIEWSSRNILIFFETILTGMLIQAGLLLLLAGLSFWLIQTGALFGFTMSINAYYMVYPQSLYHSSVRIVFAIFPVSFITYYPASVFLKKTIPYYWGSWISNYSLLIGALFFLVMLSFWRIGVRYYRSTGN